MQLDQRIKGNKYRNHKANPDPEAAVTWRDSTVDKMAAQYNQALEILNRHRKNHESLQGELRELIPRAKEGGNLRSRMAISANKKPWLSREGEEYQKIDLDNYMLPEDI